jgi:hypothetical protein
MKTKGIWSNKKLQLAKETLVKVKGGGRVCAATQCVSTCNGAQSKKNTQCNTAVSDCCV